MKKIIVLFALVCFPAVSWADDVQFEIKYGGNHVKGNYYDQKLYRKHNRYRDQWYRPKHRYNRYNHGGRYYWSAYDSWVRADQFRTRTRHVSDPVVYVNARVESIGLTGLKRNAYIYDAYAYLRNGRVMPLASLEGYLRHGENHVRHFNKPRYIEKIVFRVGPKNKRRGYVGVSYVPAFDRDGDRKRRNRDHYDD